MVDATIARISGPVAVAKDLEGAHMFDVVRIGEICLLYTSPSPRDRQKSRMPSSA